jgi:curved DNA-binding protein CbpA
LNLKDHYKSLGLSPGADLNDIKKAYRSLVMRYHPDKAGQDVVARTRFEDIQEAYDTLSNPVKKELYLQERWLRQSNGRPGNTFAENPVAVLLRALELERSVSTMDVYRLNRVALQHSLEELLAREHLERLLEFKEREMNRQIISSLLSAAKPLSLSESATTLDRLRDLAGRDDNALSMLERFERAHTRGETWDRYKVPIILFCTLVFCLLIYLANR